MPKKYIKKGRSQNIPQQFWSKVKIVDLFECWEWQAAKIWNGYGRIVVNQKWLLAHRVAYELSFGNITEGLCVLHKCDNRSCCNPAHLFLGTQADNIHDMCLKNRQSSAIGSHNYNAKLSEDDVIKIIELLKNNMNQREIADKFLVTQTTITYIKKYKTWKHVKR